MDHMTVANTIRQQLGGNRFDCMTGARLHLAHPAENGNRGALSFHLPRGAKDGINYVKIILMGSDTYTVEFTKIGPRPSWKQRDAGREQKVTLVATVEDVYADKLESIVADRTGLATRL